jgi:pyruvate kinase
MVDPSQRARIRGARAQVEQLLRDAAAAADGRAAAIAGVPAERRPSALNLAHYLAVRRHDLRPLQRQLARLSLSSLGRMEANVEATLAGVRVALCALLGEPAASDCAPALALTAERAEALLEQQAVQLLGPPPRTHRTRILVTLPAAASGDRALLRELMLSGMDAVRINLAHDDAAAWTAMVANVRGAAAECGRTCRVIADLPGPKLRTGALAPGPQVRRVRPERDVLGHVIAPARVTFRGGDASGAAAPTGDGVVPLAAPFTTPPRPGDELVVTDTRGRTRSFAVHAVDGGDCAATTDRTAYLGTGCELELRRDGARLGVTRIGALPPLPGWIELHEGDVLLVTAAATPGGAARPAVGGGTVPARIPCTLPEAIPAVLPGHRMLFDDGTIGGVVEANDGQTLTVRIVQVPPAGGRLRAEKGINLPDSDLRVPALTPHDFARLDWVAAHADVVALSFVQHAADVLQLHGELARRDRAGLGIVLKIETARGFQRLSELLFAGLQREPFGVMVARGDLAAEVGYARLAEVQEEILWLCEAAHVPVIWATQVLDSMARTGMPSRAEVTDAAMGVRAECVMLNKGPYIVPTTRFLGGVLERMEAHHAKKRSMLRALRVAGDATLAPGG